MCFSHVFEILLPDPAEVVERLSNWAFAKHRSSARGCHDSTELFIFIPRVDALSDLDRHGSSMLGD